MSQAELFDSDPTLSPEDSPARTSPSPATARASTASEAACGPSSLEFLASYDPDTRSWRTSQVSFLETGGDGLAEFLETWPRSGSMRSGIAYRRAPLVPLTKGIASGLLPTPTATEYGSSQNGINGVGGAFERPSAGTPSLSTMARRGMIPTPTAGDAKSSGSRNTANSRAHPGVSLTDYVRGDGGAGRRFPTPTARDWRSGKGRKPNGHTPHLPEQVGGQLNPTWVEWLMGFEAGWTDCEDSETPSSRRSSK